MVAAIAEYKIFRIYFRLILLMTLQVTEALQKPSVPIILKVIIQIMKQHLITMLFYLSSGSRKKSLFR